MWAQPGPILGSCWALSWLFLGVVLASSFKIDFMFDFDRFLIDLPPSETTKNIEKPMVFKHFCFFCFFALETDFGPILGRFWDPKSIKNGSRKQSQEALKHDTKKVGQKRARERSGPLRAGVGEGGLGGSWGCQVGPKIDFWRSWMAFKSEHEF